MVTCIYFCIFERYSNILKTSENYIYNGVIVLKTDRDSRLSRLKAGHTLRLGPKEMGGQGGLVVKRPPSNQKVRGSNPTTVTW